MENYFSPEKERHVATQVAQVRKQIAAAAERSGRAFNSVTLVAVTKYASPQSGFVEALLKAGCFDLAENRPQKLEEKCSVITDPRIRWHFIGTLQKNKVKKVVPKAALIHSVDTVDLAMEISRTATAKAPFPVLFQVNISEEEQKHGFSAQKVVDQIGVIRSSATGILPRGLMGMGGLNSPLEDLRKEFALLRHTFEKCQQAFPDLPLTELSMGMSGDFEIAIEEGATMVRIGSALY